MSDNNTKCAIYFERNTAFGIDLDGFVISESCDDVDLSHYDVDVEDIFDDMKNL